MAYTRPPAVTRAGLGLKQDPAPPTQAIIPVILDAEIASASQLGVVKIGSGISVTPDGVISANGSGIDYSFGAWTPVLSRSNSGTITIAIREAKFVRIGQLVTCTFDIKITDITEGSKDHAITLDNLPFTSIASSGSVGSVFFSYYKDFDKNVNYLGGTVIASDDAAVLWYQENPGKSLSLLIVDNVKVNTILVGTVTYNCVV